MRLATDVTPASSSLVNDARPRIPTIVAGGFLGSGKTTLVNHILRNADGRRIVVFINDFGEINIDMALIEAVEEDRISLSNGCVCCTLNDQLIESIAEYANLDDRPDAFLIESSGVADPRQLQSSLDVLEASGLARLEGLLYVIDVDLFFTLEHEVREQIIDHACGADLLLLNKQDIATRQQMEQIEALFDESAPYSAKLACSQCEIDMNLIFGPNRSFEAGGTGEGSAGNEGTERNEKCGKFEANRNDAINGAAIDSCKQGISRIRSTAETGHLQFSSCTLSHDQPVARGRFEAFCRSLPQHCVRAKGFVRFEADTSVHAFSLIGARASLERIQDSFITGLQLVLIGDARTFDQASINREFEALVHRD